MAQLFANAARAELAATINSSDALLTIDAGGALFPVANTGASAIGPGADWFKAVLQDDDGIEIIYVRTHTSASLTFSNILRGQEGTTAKGFLAGSVIGIRPTAGDADFAVKKQPATVASDTAPLNPHPGQEWVDGTSGIKYTWVDDGTSQQWVDLSGGGLPSSFVSSLNGLVGNISLKTVGGVPIVGTGDIEVVAEVTSPINITPLSAATGINESPILVGSAYYSIYNASHAATQVQVSSSESFTSLLYDSGDQAGSTSFTLPAGYLFASTTYYWRMRYKSLRGVYSNWSEATTFSTAAEINSYIVTPAATPAIGTAMEGGFYAGMIWNELQQSASSTAIGTGSKSFTVPSMSGAGAIVYAGQTLEVRSRANPANKMVGTVTGAVGTTLTLNVTSVGGGGTFADWSIMSRYRVIVAPKASGENGGIAYKNDNSAAPAATGTLTEGRKATLAMVGADTSAVYPAAHWCNNLSIGGKTDWYLPARDELELCWRNLKPVTTANYTASDRPAAATPNYQNLGSYGGTEATHGLNNNSNPAGATYTGPAPAQTGVAAFQTGGAEAYEFGSTYYWSSTEYNASFAWLQHWHSSYPGNQNYTSKANTNRVRAVRRSII